MIKLAWKGDGQIGIRRLQSQKSGRFLSQRLWHAQYVPCFQNIADHENMVEWLGGSGSDMDEEVWDFKKAIYQYSDLKEWLDKKQKQKQKEKKGG